jgi:hypothetical protein
MKLRLVAVALVCVLLATGAWAQAIIGSPRAAAMGGAGIGVADDAAAWYQNPAGLAALNVPCREGAEYATQAVFSYANTDDDDAYELNVSGWNPSQLFGYGAGYVNAGGIFHASGVGFGAGFKNMPLSVGFNVINDRPDGDATYLNAGVMYRISQGEGKEPIRFGLAIDDLTDRSDMGPFYHIGIGWKPVNNLLIAVDATDLTDEWDDGVGVSGGIEYAFNGSAGRQILGRAGMMDSGDDHLLTLGVGYQAKGWHVDFAWVDTDPDSTWTIGLGCDM